MGRSCKRVVKKGFGGCAHLNFSCLIVHCEIACPIPIIEANATTPVSNPLRIPRRAWLIAPLLALVFTAAATVIRVRRDRVRLGGCRRSGVRPSSPAAQAPAAPSEWHPRLIIPGNRNESFEWLDQVRQMFERRQWRVRYVDYENALVGRRGFRVVPLQVVAGPGRLVPCQGCRHRHRPLDRVGGALRRPHPPCSLRRGHPGLRGPAVRRAGGRPGFRCPGGVLPARRRVCRGAARRPRAGRRCARCGVSFRSLPASGASHSADSGRLARRWFAVGGVVGGIGLWVNVSRQMPVLIGIAVGAVLAEWVSRGPRGGTLRAIRCRSPGGPGVAGSVTCLGAYLLEFFPSYMGGWELRSIHPILAWHG